MSNKSIQKNTIYNLIKTVSQIVFPLITFPYISRVLGAENVGKIDFGNSIVGYITLLASLGISTYAIRECGAAKDKEELEQISGEIYSINILSTAVAYLVLGGLLLFWKPLQDYRKLILIQSMVVIFTTFGAEWINSAMEDFKYITLRTFWMQVVSLVAMFLFVHTPEDYMKYAVITMLAASGANIVNAFYRRKYCKMRFSLKIDWKRHIKPILLLFSMLLAQQIFVNVDVTMIGVIHGDYEVGLYSTSTKIYLMVNQVLASVAFVVMPRMSGYFKTKDYEGVNSLFRYCVNVILGFGIPCVVGMCLLAPEILEIVGGAEYVAASGSLRILAIALLFSLVSGLFGNIILLPAGREDVCLKSCIISAMANFILNCILIKPFGINAAAFTTAVSQLITLLIGVCYIEKEIDLKYMGKVFSQAMFSVVMVIIICLLTKHFISQLFIRIIVSVGLSAVVYILEMLLLKNEFFLDIKNQIIRK